METVIVQTRTYTRKGLLCGIVDTPEGRRAVIAYEPKQGESGHMFHIYPLSSVHAEPEKFG